MDTWRGGARLGSRLTDNNKLLAQRLAHWLNRAIDAGRAAPGSASDGEEGAGEIDFDERPRACKAALVEHAAVVGEMPDDGVVTAEQAESRATRKSTRGGVLEYLLAARCARLCQRCDCRVEACLLPDFVVVHVPDYAGPRCLDNLPNTWVPAPCVEVAQGSHCVRHGRSRYTNLKA